MTIAALLTLIFRRIGVQDGYDQTRPSDYTADPLPVPAAAAGTRTRGTYPAGIPAPRLDLPPCPGLPRPGPAPGLDLPPCPGLPPGLDLPQAWAFPRGRTAPRGQPASGSRDPATGHAIGPSPGLVRGLAKAGNQGAPAGARTAGHSERMV